MHFNLTPTNAGSRIGVLATAATIATMGLAGSLTSSAQALAPESCADADTPVEQLTQEAAEAAVVCLVNQQRSAAGLAELTQAETLTSAARGHGNDAVEIKWWNEGDPHVNPITGSTPGDRITAAGYCPNPISWMNGENVYWGYSSGAGAVAPTPGAAVSWWMNSPGHRANILNPNYTELGVGVVLGTAAPVNANAAATFVQDFGACTN